VHPLTKFRNRLLKIGIEVEFLGNIPYIYLTKINGQKVTEKFHANHGFTVAFNGMGGFKFTELKEIFKLIRKYVRSTT